MNSYILNRSQGSIRPSNFHGAQSTRLVHCLEPAPEVRFSSSHGSYSKTEGWEDDVEDDILAHRAGVNVLTVDPYEKRL